MVINNIASDCLNRYAELVIAIVAIHEKIKRSTKYREIYNFENYNFQHDKLNHSTPTVASLYCG